MNPQNPLIVQSDRTLLLEVNNSLFVDARDAISVFAHLEKSPEYMHTYVITPLSLWNAAALGLSPDEAISRLEHFSKYPVPQNVTQEVYEFMGRFGKLVLEKRDGRLVLHSKDAALLENLSRHPTLRPLIGPPIDAHSISVSDDYRGLLKQALIGIGYPANDKAGYVDGAPFEINLRHTIRGEKKFSLRNYQRQAADAFVGDSTSPGGSGVVVLPCGAGKTVVGMGVMSLLKRRTLILVTNITAARQWSREIVEKTDINPEDIGEYSGEKKEIKPLTIATYQILTYRRRKTDSFEHYSIFNKENWGLIIYDEVHLLPAPVFKFTANLQARRRLGLTATLVREDGHEDDVFTLIGPKKFDVPWKELEKQGWIAEAKCIEIRIDLPHSEKMQYLSLPPKQQIRLAYENPVKMQVAREILNRHTDDRILIIGLYISQLKAFSKQFGVPMITGSTPNDERDKLYQQFRTGELKVLILSKVGNFAIDLPEANVAVQISGSYGSRQEEAQRLGRILRPKEGEQQATFYSIVTRESKELDFAMKRQLFLTEQGYSYQIINQEEYQQN